MCWCVHKNHESLGVHTTKEQKLKITPRREMKTWMLFAKYLVIYLRTYLERFVMGHLCYCCSHDKLTDQMFDSAIKDTDLLIILSLSDRLCITKLSFLTLSIHNLINVSSLSSCFCQILLLIFRTINIDLFRQHEVRLVKKGTKN